MLASASKPHLLRIAGLSDPAYPPHAPILFGEKVTTTPFPLRKERIPASSTLSSIPIPAYDSPMACRTSSAEFLTMPPVTGRPVQFSR